MRENPISWSQTKYVINNFKFSFGVVNGFDSAEMIYFDFIVKKNICF